MPSGVQYPDNKPPTVREVNLSAEIKKIWGPKWNEPEIAYEFGTRKFTLRTGDAAIYASSPDF